MDIVYLCSSIIPSRAANSVHVMKMCQALARNGHTVTLLAPTKRGEYEPGVDDVFKFYDVDPIFQLQKLSCPRIKGRSFIYAFALARAVQRIRPDLVFGRYVHGCALTASMGYPTIFEAHQPVWDISWIHDLFFEVLRRSSSFCKLIVISNALRKIYLDKKNIEAHRVLVVHDAADSPETLNAVELSERREEVLQVGYIGNLYPGKGMRVIAEIGPRLPEIDFHVVGGLEEDVVEWRQRIGVPNIHIHGFVDQTQVPRYIAAMDVCLLPNQRSVSVYGSNDLDIGRYTSPLKMFEYMSHGRPIIASNLPVLKEVLRHGENALLCDPENPDAWVEAIQRLAVNDSLRCRLGERAREDFLNQYTWETRAKRVIRDIGKFI